MRRRISGRMTGKSRTPLMEAIMALSETECISSPETSFPWHGGTTVTRTVPRVLVRRIHAHLVRRIHARRIHARRIHAHLVRRIHARRVHRMTSRENRENRTNRV